MVECMEQGRCQSQYGGGFKSISPECKCESKPNKYKADILDRAVREYTLQIVLEQCVEHAHQRRRAAEGKNYNPPPPDRRPEQIEHDADEGVDRDLGHH